MRNTKNENRTANKGFVAGLNGETDWIKVDEEIFDYVGKRISEGDTANPNISALNEQYKLT
ncbi:MAG: hypothetical protein AAB071_06190 [Bacteroidota bacterium]